MRTMKWYQTLLDFLTGRHLLKLGINYVLANMAQEVKRSCIPLSIALLNGEIAHQAGYYFHTSMIHLEKCVKRAPLVCECGKVCHTIPNSVT